MTKQKSTFDGEKIKLSLEQETQKLNELATLAKYYADCLKMAVEGNKDAVVLQTKMLSLFTEAYAALSLCRTKVTSLRELLKNNTPGEPNDS